MFSSAREIGTCEIRLPEEDVKKEAIDRRRWRDVCCLCREPLSLGRTLKDKENRFNFPNAREVSLPRLIRSSSFFLLLLFLLLRIVKPRHFALFVFRLPVLVLSLLPVEAFPLPRRRFRGFSALFPSPSRWCSSAFVRLAPVRLNLT